MARYLYWEARSFDEVRTVLASKITQAVLREDGRRLTLAVELPELRRLVGEVTLAWLSREHRQGEIGFILHPDFQGRGIATEAAQVMLRLGFEGLDLHRITGRCDARNLGSARVMERLGMRREALFVESEIFKGEWGDELVYAILQEEWARHRPGGRAGAGEPLPPAATPERPRSPFWVEEGRHLVEDLTAHPRGAH